MKLLWTLFKVGIALLVGIPLLIIALGMAFGVLAFLVGIALLVLKIAVAGLIGVALFRFIGGMLGGRHTTAQPPSVHQLPPVDPHYEAAMRELDRELGEGPSR